MKLKLETLLVALVALSPLPLLGLHAAELLFHHKPSSSLSDYLRKNTFVRIVDWNSDWFLFLCWPSIWLKVRNYNSLPIKNVTIRYRTYNDEGKLLNEGTHVLAGEIKPGESKNFFSQSPGLIDFASSKLSVDLVNVKCAVDEK